MKYRFAVEAVYIKEIEIDAADEDEAFEKAHETAYGVEYGPGDEACYDRTVTLLEY